LILFVTWQSILTKVLIFVLLDVFRHLIGSYMFSVADNITPTVELNTLAMKRGEQTFYKPLDTRYPHYPQQNYNYRGVYNHRLVLSVCHV